MKTYASVWDAIEDSHEAAESMKARALLMMKIEKVVRRWPGPQAAAAQRLGITQPRLNNLLRGRIEKFSLDALFDLASRAGMRISIGVKKAA